MHIKKEALDAYDAKRTDRNAALADASLYF